MRRQGTRQLARTVLEQLIRARQQTFEEFAEYAESFARESGEPGTLSVRHLQRLVAGRRSDGSPLAPLRPATARLLERIFELPIGDLLRPPDGACIPPGVPSATRTEAHALRVAIAVVVNGANVLIVRRRESADAVIHWQFPAGVVKPGASAEGVAVSETFGETGVHCIVNRRLGTRIHPITSVICDYMYCEYLTGDAKNLDVVENAGVSWVDKTRLTRFISANLIFPPVLQALGPQPEGFSGETA